MNIYDDEPQYEDPWDAESMEFKIKIQNIQEDVFVSAIARDLASRVSIKMLRKIEEHVEETILKTLTDRVDETISGLIENGMQTHMQPSDQFSNPKGEPITLTEFIAEKASGYLEEKVGRDGKPSTGSYGDAKTTRLNFFLSMAIDSAFEKEVNAGVAEIKGTIRAQMKDAAAAWLSKFQAETVSGIEAAKALASRI